MCWSGIRGGRGRSRAGIRLRSNDGREQITLCRDESGNRGRGTSVVSINSHGITELESPVVFATVDGNTRGRGRSPSDDSGEDGSRGHDIRDESGDRLHIKNVPALYRPSGDFDKAPRSSLAACRNVS